MVPRAHSSGAGNPDAHNKKWRGGAKNLEHEATCKRGSAAVQGLVNGLCLRGASIEVSLFFSDCRSLK